MEIPENTINIIMSTETLQSYVNSLFIEIYEKVNNDQSLNFVYSGQSLTSKIDPNAKILDVGCGRNLFKPFFPNLIGVDPVTNEADVKLSIQDYNTDERFDVAFCFGSIHFGNEIEIKEIISKIITLLKPNSKIYWRSPILQTIPLQFIWNPKIHERISQEMGYTLVNWKIDHHLIEGKNKFFRWYAEWERVTSINN